MAVYNPRLDLARAAQKQAKSSSVQTLQSVLKQQTMDGDLRKDYTASGGAAPKTPDIGGWKGLIADVIDSPVGKVVLKAGEILTIPGRAVVSSINEIKDQFDSDPNTSASWNDFTKQTLDPMYGFGTLTGDLTGNKWLDRTIGFAGDVLLDPLTYVTLGAGRISGGMKLLDEAGAVIKGAKGISITGKEGRLAFATRLAEIGATDDVVVAAARYGRVAVKDADLLAKAGVNRAGLYFMGKRIAGTTKVGTKFERGLVGMRTWSGDHLFKRSAELFDSTDMNAARKALARGTATSEQGMDYLHMVVSRNTERAAIASNRREAQLLQRQLLNAVSADDLRNARKTAYKLLDNVDPGVRAGTATADERLAQPVTVFLKQLHENVDAAAKAIDVDSPIGFIKNYFPHMPGDQAYRFMANTENPTAVKLSSLLYNPLTNEGAFKSRMGVGDDFFGYILKQEDIDGGLERLNQIARDYGKINFDFFETDLPTVLDRYVEMYSAQMGKIARKKYLVEKGTFKRLEERLLVNDDMVKAASKELKKAVADRSKAMTGSAKSLSDLNKQLDDMFEARILGLGEQIDALTAQSKNILADSSLARQAMFTAQRSLDSVIEKLVAQENVYGRIVGGRPEVLNILENEYSRVIKNLQTLREEANVFESVQGNLRSRLVEASKELEQLQKLESRLTEFGNVIQSRFDDIMTGYNPSNAKQLAENMRAALFGENRVEGGRNARVFGDRQEPLDGKLWSDLQEKVIKGRTGGPRGKMTPEKRSLLNERYEAAGGEWSSPVNTGVIGQRWWVEANSASPIPPSKVEDMMAADKLVDTIYRGMRDEASLTDLRTAALAVLANGDDTVIPKEMGDALKKLLVESAEADNFYAKLNAQEVDKMGRLRLESLDDDYSRVERQVTDSIYELHAAYKLKKNLFENTFDPNDVIPIGTLSEMLDRPEYQSLQKYFQFDESIEDLAGMSQAFDFGDISGVNIRASQSIMSDVSSTGERVGAGQMSGRTVGGGDFTFGDFEKMLSNIIDEAEGRTFEVRSTITGAFGQAKDESVLVKKIDIADVIGKSKFWSGSYDPVSARLRKGEMTFDEVTSFIEDAVTGKRTVAGGSAKRVFTGETLASMPPVQALKGMNKSVPGLTRLMKSRGIDERMIKWITGAVDAAPYASMNNDVRLVGELIQERLIKLNSRLKDLPESSWNEIDRLALDNITLASRQIVDASLAIKGEISSIIPTPVPRGNLPKARIINFKEELADDSLRGLMQATRQELLDEYGIDRGVLGVGVSQATYDESIRAVRGTNLVAGAKSDVQRGVGGRKGVASAKNTVRNQVTRATQEDIRARLSTATVEAWFTSETNARFARLADSLFKEGLVPDIDMYRKIVNVVAKQHGDVLQGQRAVYRTAQSELKSLIERVDGWGGDPADLYVLIDNALSKTAGDDIYDWVSLVNKVNGREDVYNIRREFLRLGGTEGNSGIPKRIRAINSKLRSKTLSAEERISLEAEKAALPSEALLKSRKKAASVRWSEWYKTNVDQSVEKATYKQLEDVLRARAQIKTTGGRLSEDASSREMITWLKTTLERIDDAFKKQSGTTGWLTGAADPFVDVNTMLIGGRKIGQDLPSMYTAALRSYANEYEVALESFSVATGKSERASGRLAGVIGDEPALIAQREALVSPKGGQRLNKNVVVTDEAVAAGTAAAIKDDTAALYAARQAHRKLVALQSSPEFFAAVERKELNDLLRLFTPYAIDGETDFILPLTSSSIARKTLNGDVAGSEIFFKEADGTFSLVDDVSQINSKNIYYKKNVSDATSKKTQYVPLTKEQYVRYQTYVGEGDARQIGPTAIFRLTDVELDALFSEPAEFTGRRLSARIALDKEMKDIDNQLLRLDPRDIIIQSRFDRVDQLRNLYKKGINDSLGTFKYGRLNKMSTEERYIAVLGEEQAKELFDIDASIRAVPKKTRDKIVELRANSQKLSKQRDALGVKNPVTEKARQGAALQKMHGLLQAIKDGDLSFDDVEAGLKKLGDDSRVKKFNRATNQEIGRRRKVLNDAWEPSVEKKYLDKVWDAENTVEVERFKSALADTDQSLETIRMMRQKADEASKAVEKFADNLTVSKTKITGVPFARVPLEVKDGLFDDIYRATLGQYDGRARYEELVVAGKSDVEAFATIGDEVVALRPQGETLLTPAGKLSKQDLAGINLNDKIRGIVKNAEKLQSLRDEVGYLKVASDNMDELLYSGIAGGRKGEIAAMEAVAEQLKKALRYEEMKFYDLGGGNIIRGREEVLLAAATEFDTTNVLKMEFKDWYSSVMPHLRSRLADAEAGLAASKVKGELPIGKSAVARAEYLNWVDEASDIVLQRMNPTVDNVDGASVELLNRLRADYISSSQKLLEAEMRVVDLNNSLAMFKSGEWGGIASKELTKGFESLAKFGMPSFQARREIAEMFDNVNRLREPDFVRGLNKFIGRYTGFFKAYATASPGFVVRNTMSNTFMLVASGADPRNLMRGLGLFNEWRQAVKTVGERAWIETLPDDVRGLVETAVRSMDAAGKGRGAEAMRMWKPKRKWLTENKYLRTFQSANEVTENSARFMLAFDQVTKGASFDQATATVKRFLFDYEDVGRADLAMRTVIPFWFWMSRNLPLQITNRYANPRAYNIYRSAMNNFGEDIESEDNVPSWLVQSGATKIGEGLFFAPDLGFNRVNEQINQLKDPKRLLSYVNPLLRVPFETALSDKRFYNDVPFGDKPQQAVGGPLSPVLQSLAGLLGQSRPMSGGEQGVTDKFNYGIMNMIPPLAQAERLVPSTDIYKGRQAGSIMSWLGSPLRQVTPEMENSERRRRVYEQQALHNIAGGGK